MTPCSTHNTFAIWTIPFHNTSEPQREKSTFWHVRPTKTQISLRIRTVWSEPSMSACRNFPSLSIQNTPVKILIRLRECAGWSESSLGAYFGRYVFCRYAHLCVCNFYRMTDNVYTQWSPYEQTASGSILFAQLYLRKTSIHYNPFYGTQPERRAFVP